MTTNSISQVKKIDLKLKINDKIQNNSNTQVISTGINEQGSGFIKSNQSKTGIIIGSIIGKY